MATSMEKWASIVQRPAIVGFFAGLFDGVGIRIAETGEAFTCIHRGDRVDFAPGIDESAVDFVVTIEAMQVDRLAAEAAAGELSEAERYRILRAFFTPAAAATLKNPLLSHPLVRKLSGAEDLIHVTLEPVAGESPYSHTLVYANRQWLAFPGLHGRAARKFSMTMEQALEYHRRSLAAIKANRLDGWVSFARWYRRWRAGVSKVEA